MGNPRDAIAEKQVGGRLTFRLHHDEDPGNPRDGFTCLGRIVTWDRRLNLGREDEFVFPNHPEGREDREDIFTPGPDDMVWDLMAYETRAGWRVWIKAHRPAAARPNQVGYMVVTPQRLEVIGLRRDQMDMVMLNLQAEAIQYQHFLSGNVYQIDAHGMFEGNVLEKPITILADIYLADDYRTCWDALDEAANSMLPDTGKFGEDITEEMERATEWK